jgi:acetyl-CoA carboxylase biotin carboxylase subunit
MFKRVLIANRGEIALRIIRALKEMGIESVVVYSEADRNSLPVKYADYSICIGPGNPKESYLDISRIMTAAEISDIDAIHPGYGFLAENPDFSRMCRECNIRFIGSNEDGIRLAGDKVMAKQLVKRLRIPILPGSDNAIKDEKAALEVAHKVGYPVILKAAGGGGGRGMRLAHNDASLIHMFHQAQAEAESAFKDKKIYIEKFIEDARHIEIQVLLDNYGNAVYLGERDCTIQRRFQKLIEECPSVVVSPSLRRDMGNAAVSLMKAAKYTNAGTVEFLVDSKGKFYFMEVNARIQVEHPVTEMTTGVDLIKEQIRISAGHKLSFSQKDIDIKGVAIECRINSEDPDNNFRPSPGLITEFCPPTGPGIRVDTCAYPGYTIPPFYDSLIAKLIVHKKTRIEAIRSMKQALQEFIINGVKTTIPLHLAIMDHAQFISGRVTTTFVERVLGK